MKFKLTLEYLTGKFDEYNDEYFEGRLSRAVIEISHTKSFLGRCGYKYVNCRKIHYIEVSDYFVRPEREICNTLLHEMIHYYIQQFGLRDSSAHGRIFKSEAARINRFGWHIGTHGTSAGCETKVKEEYKLMALEYGNAYYIVRVNDYKLASYARSVGCKGIVKFTSTDGKLYGRLRTCRTRLSGMFITKEEYERISRMCA